MNRNITATILIILAIGIYYTMTDKILAEANAVREVNAKYQSAIESAKELISKRDQVLSDYNNLSQDDRMKLEQLLPKSVDNIRLIIDLNSVALRHGFSLKGIKATTQASTETAQNQSGPIMGDAATTLQTNPGPVLSSSSLDRVTVTFSVSAPYRQFISFLQDLEASLRILDVSHLSVSANDKGVYDWNVELVTYWLKSQ